MKRGFFASVIITVLVLSGCNNYFHDLIPPDENKILSFTVPGQIEPSEITANSIYVTVGKDAEIHSLLPVIKISYKAKLIPLTYEYIQEAFPSADIFTSAVGMYTTNNITDYVFDLIRENQDFNVPAIIHAIDFSGPVDFLVISGQGNIRRYTVYVMVDTGEPRILSFTFAKYDNEELMGDSLSYINENEKTVIAAVVYPAEMTLSYALIPSFAIRGDSFEIDGQEIQSGKDSVHFNQSLGAQNKTITVWRDGLQADYNLTVNFTEDPDTIRSITDFRFTTANNPSIAANAVASIVNTENTGTITVQVLYTGVKPQNLTPRFVSPGTVSVTGIAQTSGVNSHDFSAPVEYRVISRNGLYSRLYTVKVEFISMADSPRINSFRFSQNINPDLVQDSEAVINDGSIMIDAYYGSLYAPDTLIPEFTADGIVTVYNSVQISGSSAQSFSRQIKYTVTNPQNPLLARDYWVQVRMTRDTSSDAKITAFGFYRAENNSLNDDIVAKVDQATGKITVFAPIGSGVTSRTMYPRYEAVGQVSVGGVVQSSGNTPQTFAAPIVYTVTSANGKNNKTYTVEVRELRSTIFVKPNAWGYNDGSSWDDAFKTLKEACEAAAQFPEDVPKEIWIAAGTYKPGVTTEDYFLLSPNTSYIGGFSGNETAKNQRNAASNKVTISGDLGGGRYSNNLFGSFDGTTSQTINGDLNFEDLALENAKAISGRVSGAAICAVLPNGAELNISHCNFKSFTASADGGAVYVRGGSVEIADTVIEDVQADDGGAVYSVNASALTISNLSITNARASTAINTGGIYNNSGTLTVDGLTLRNITGIGIRKFVGGNVSLSGIDADNISGDAVFCEYISSSSVRIGDSKFNNTGRVYVTASVPVQVTDTEITNNSGSSALEVDSGNAAATIEHITINRVPTGRGISVASTNSVLIRESQIRNCTFTVYGGGIKFEGANCEISGVIIENCTANGNGGGIWSAAGSGNLNISNVIIKNCTSGDWGGGWCLFVGGNQIISGVTIENCTAIQGGGIFLSKRSGGNTEISNITIENCTATQGGGIRFEGLENIETSSVTIKNCTATWGGGIFLGNERNNEISGVIIENCTANYNGGGIYIANTYTISTSLSVSNITIKNCTADRGGGIYTYTNTNNTNSSINLSFSNITIENCTANFGGGGMCLSSAGNIEISGVTIENCTANYYGGGIFENYSLSLSISDTIIKNAVLKASNGHGGGVSCSAKLVVTNSRFENCRSMGRYGAIEAVRDASEITNTYFINCSSQIDCMIFFARRFEFIRNCTFTHDSNLVDLGPSSVDNVLSVFGDGGGNFEGCTFNNLKSNFAGENYLFCRYTYYPNTSTGGGGTANIGSELTLRNCTFNFNSGSAGLIALSATTVAGIGSDPDYLLMDNCRINNNNGQQPLIWLVGNNPTGTFRFRTNNYYNGTLLNNAAAITTNLVNSGVMRLTNGATPVLVQ